MYIGFVVFHVLFALSQLLFECFLDHSIVVHYVFLISCESSLFSDCKC